ncbi:Cof-type HAD-IIB family hydrolase [Deinococcus sp. KSM4-11]|uniref:Cof-type HAD-IIB family hydrolase n=1 Tax=Deinococcus sp. KSM4-11 TaxID=2568654 RepID=UPI0010A51E67|nr:Cof-type HAD-IIB family hydrolase [Deinococcus sp. KSM4-11]THF88362.1 Cof-type HAD-IIB family hydrolase [Deinococcus sp. KSM4-11]
MLGLICVDVDGTLVGSGNVVRDDVWAALADARARGVRIALCSGRPALGNALAYALRLDGDGWHVFQNGASIVNVGSHESLSEPMPDGSVASLLGHAHAVNRLLEVYTDTEFAISQPGILAERHAALLGLPYEPRSPESLDGTVVRAQWVVPLAEQEQVMAEPHDGLALHPAGSPAMPDTMFISITKAGIGKGVAIRKVAQRYGLDMERVMMVGDGENDIAAMNVVGHPVAMGNAVAAAVSASRYRVGHVDAGGLREAVELALTL